MNWPIEHSGYSIESTADITGGWTPFAVVVTTNATQFFFDVPAPPAQRFFRLVK
ncbi:MAG: hypothetical protein ABI042_03400 [Verrucomicrobiota bacterium]